MHIENLTIITGSPKKAAAKAQEFLNAHPNATILGTALTHKRGEPVEPKEAEPAKESKAKDKDEPAAAILRSVEYTPDIPVMAITLGHVFP